MSDPMSRLAAIDRIVAMRYDAGQTWDLSPKDQEALCHAVQAFSDVDALRVEVDRLRAAQCAGRQGEGKAMSLTCAWREPAYEDEDFPSGDLCGAPAKWLSCKPYINMPTCDEHKCRCLVPINGPAPVASAAEQERDVIHAKLEAMTKRAEEAERQLAEMREITDLMVGPTVTERDELRAALQEIAAGKTSADNGCPMGENWSMAGRFVTIAQRALRTPTTQVDQRKKP